MAATKDEQQEQRKRKSMQTSQTQGKQWVQCKKAQTVCFLQMLHPLLFSGSSVQLNASLPR